MLGLLPAAISAGDASSANCNDKKPPNDDSSLLPPLLPPAAACSLLPAGAAAVLPLLPLAAAGLLLLLLLGGGVGTMANRLKVFVKSAPAGSKTQAAQHTRCEKSL